MAIIGTQRNPIYTPNTRSTIEYQRFSGDYFSGCDVKVYFGDVLVDDILSLEFELYENVAPVYGYASYTYDAVARGTRIIQGKFRIAFKEAYYIHAVTNQIEYENDNSVEKEIPYVFDSTYKENTIEGILSAAQGLSSDNFNKLANQYQDSFWGKSTSSFTARVQEQSETTYFYPDHEKSHRQNGLRKNGLSIVVTYGPIDRENTNNGKYNAHSTAETITGVHISGVSKIVEPTGRPIYEEYSFVAKDINNSIR